MIHLYILIAFGTSIVSALIGYEQNTYAIFISICILSLVIFRFLFQIKRSVIQGFICVCIAVCIYIFIQNSITVQNLQYRSGFIYKDKSHQTLQGTLLDFPSYRFENNQYVLTLENSSTKILLYTQPYQKFSYLDSLKFSGSVIDVRSQGTEWQNYYKKLDVQYIIWYPQEVEHHATSPTTLSQKLLHHIFIFKQFLRTKSMERFSSHTSALVLGMLLGEKEELSKEEKDLFRAANLSHILVVSGYNISLVLGFIFLLFKSTHRYMQTSIAVGAVFLFVSLVGYDASIVRSALMGSIVVCAKLLHRQASGVHTLLLVASIMLISNPLSIFDAGFHLSFVATYALLIMPEIKKIPEYTMTTVWVSVFVCPYILYLSGALSMIGIGINIAVLFCIPFFMLVASASLVLSALHIFVGIDVVILEVISRYIFSMTKIAALFPPAQYQISPSVTMVIYVLLFSCVSFFSNRYTTAEFIEKHYQKFSLQNSN